MTFLTWAALAVGLFVAAPIAAHLLRRRRAGEIKLPTARLLSQSPPNARRRSAIEDRSLLLVRLLAILALAALGASPFVSCSHLTLSRKAGGSVALVFVVDDSLSMRAPMTDGVTRFERAQRAARDLLDASRDGDSIAIVLAGAPPRVGLATTTDLDAAKRAVASLEAGDRATDLDAALTLARDLVKSSPQRDRRVVLLSDLADGHADGAPLDIEGASLWYPAPDLGATSQSDCAIVAAERKGVTVTIDLACTPGASAAGRAVELVGESGTLAKTTVPASSNVVVVELPADAPDVVDARLEATDAIRSDDFAPVTVEGHDLSLAIVSDASLTRVETGGPPPVEQALAALELGRYAHALPSVPDHEEDLAKHAGLVLDDPPGLTPEERRAVSAWVEGGGTLLLALGRHASSAPLGAGFGSLLPGVVRFRAETPRGADPARCSFFGQSADSLVDLSPKGRILLDHDAVDDAEVLCTFSDGEPLLLRRSVGRGAVYVSTLPFDLETSDLPVRPGFLALLDRFSDAARMRGGPRVVEAGVPFLVPGTSTVDATFAPTLDAKPHEVEVERTGEVPRVPTQQIGRYVLTVDGTKDLRVALAPAAELDLRPRAIAPHALDASLGGKADQMDAAPYVALALLGLMLAEILLRVVFAGRGEPRPATPTEPPPSAA